MDKNIQKVENEARLEKLQEASQEESVDEQKNSENAGEGTSSIADGEKEEEAKAEEGENIRRETASKLGMNILHHHISSKYVIETTTDITYLQFFFEKEYQSLSSYADLWYGYEISLGQPVVKLEQDISFYYHLSFHAIDKKMFTNFSLKASLFFEQFNFVNLPEIGEGLQASSNSLLSLKLETMSQFESKDFNFNYGFVLGRSIFSMTDYDNLSGGLEGMTFGLKIEIPKLYKNLNLMFDFERTMLSAKTKVPLEISGRVTDSLEVGYNKISVGTVMSF